jgi:hypothetical protein
MNSPHLAALPSPDDLYDALKGNVQMPMHPILAAICVELVPLIETIAGAFYDEAEQVLQNSSPDMVYTPAKLDADLSNHLDPLCHLIPPIEHRHGDQPKAASLAGILNVGWAALLAKLGDLPATAVQDGGDPNAQQMEKLHELLLKAVELSDARLTWEEI